MAEARKRFIALARLKLNGETWEPGALIEGIDSREAAKLAREGLIAKADKGGQRRGAEPEESPNAGKP